MSYKEIEIKIEYYFNVCLVALAISWRRSFDLDNQSLGYMVMFHLKQTHCMDIMPVHNPLERRGGGVD